MNSYIWKQLFINAPATRFAFVRITTLLVETVKLFIVCNTIQLNPVFAGILNTPFNPSHHIAAKSFAGKLTIND